MKSRAFIGAVFSGIIGVLALLSSSAGAVDNFTITQFDIAMKLGTDDAGRSTLVTTETITADFPMANENRGLERAFVKTYKDHSTDFHLLPK